MPVFVKLSPNSSINAACAVKVKEAGGIGVTTTNTMSSFMDPTGDNLPWPKVGKKNETYYGGAAGSVIRPIALRVSSEISMLNLGLEQMATGGIVSGDHAMSYLLYGGCSVFQVCSAVQENDFSIIQDLTTGLKANIYLNHRKDLILKGWKGQSPPVLSMQKLKSFKNDFGLWEKDEEGEELDVKKLPKLNDLKGKGQIRIEHVTSMDNSPSSQQFPHIDNDLCVNCGKCYMTCLDSGYQAIKFNADTHIPEITKDCTGCGLCFAVCPVPGALIFKDRELEYKPNRGDEYFEPKI
jgi:dihydropyrimidine dehydrogenase (NADP+)